MVRELVVKNLFLNVEENKLGLLVYNKETRNLKPKC